MIETHGVDILCISETWKVKGVASPTFKGYKVLARADKKTPTGIGGGLIVYVKHNLRFRLLKSHKSPVKTAQIIHFRNNITDFIFTYRSPNQTPEEANRVFLTYATYASRCQNAVLFGDLNLPQMNWATLTDPTPIGEKFVGHMRGIGMTQVIMEPTRQGNILDVVLLSLIHI